MSNFYSLWAKLFFSGEGEVTKQINIVLKWCSHCTKLTVTQKHTVWNNNWGMFGWMCTIESKKDINGLVQEEKNAFLCSHSQRAPTSQWGPVKVLIEKSQMGGNSFSIYQACIIVLFVKPWTIKTLFKIFCFNVIFYYVIWQCFGSNKMINWSIFRKKMSSC